MKIALALALISVLPRCPSAHIAATMPGMPKGCDCTARAEQLWPSGTRVYAYDEYVVIDGHRNVHFSDKAQFRCDAQQMHVYDTATQQRESFSLAARIIRWKDAKEVAVYPGKPMPTKLKGDIALGIAYYKTTVKSK